MKTAALVAAAGVPSPTGGFKPLLKLGSISIVHRVILTLKHAGCFPIVLITGHQARQLESHVKKLGVICLRNEAYASGQMLDSVKIGLDFLRERCDRLLFTPVDIPLFTAGTALQLLESRADFAVPVCGGQRGHPLLIDAGRFEDILKYDGPGGLELCIEACGGVTEVEVPDPGTLWDVETPMDYEAILARHSEQLLRPLVTLQLAREEVFFGPALAMLLALIQESGSVQTACGMINLSYSKVWALINTAERELGYPILSRTRGGVLKGGSSLTPEGERLLERFNTFEAEATDLVEALFSRHFPDMC